MKMLRIGLIAEGKTDHIVLKALLSAYVEIQRPELDVQFVEIQPVADKTSQNAGGGWTEVYKWCLQNPPALRRSAYLGRALFSEAVDATRCDLLVIVLDADASAKIATKSTIPPPPPAPAPTARGAFICQTLDSWLWPNGLVDRHKHVTAAAVEAIETWLFSAFEKLEDAEMISDVDAQFATSYYPAVGKPYQPGVKRVGKTEANYALISFAARPRINDVHARCRHFQDMVGNVLIMADA